MHINVKSTGIMNIVVTYYAHSLVPAYCISVGLIFKHRAVGGLRKACLHILMRALVHTNVWCVCGWVVCRREREKKREREREREREFTFARLRVYKHICTIMPGVPDALISVVSEALNEALRVKFSARVARSTESANECCCNAVKDFQGSWGETSHARDIRIDVLVSTLNRDSF